MDFKLETAGSAAFRLKLVLLYKTVIALILATMLSGLEPCRADDNTGPVRLARFSYLSGSVTWHYGDDASWADAVRNLPLREGAQIWTADSSRAEIQFDDGSRLRLDSNTLVTLQTLYSDDKGEYTELTLNSGSMHMHLKTRYSIYQLNTPYAALKAAGPSRFNVAAGDVCAFKQYYGFSTIDGNGGSATLQQGQALFLNDANSVYQVVNLPAPDAWDTWNEARDARIDNPDRNQYLPPDIALECADLSNHGNWHHDRRYGWVWAPTVTVANWRPYGAGSWTWVHPFGWTWVSADTWGWAPYHYGSWIHAEYGWAWVPGPANQYWSPGVVSFHQVNGGIAWVPLAPNEIRYPPALTIGFRTGNWSTFFSIGGAAVYYPGAGNFCEPRPWTSAYINTTPFNRNLTNVTVNNTFLGGSSFYPANAQYGGGTFVTNNGFGGREGYQPITASQSGMIRNGRVIGAPLPGQHPVMGPPGVRLTQAALVPNRSFIGRPAVPQNAITRPVFRAPLPKSVPQTQIAQSNQRLLTPSTSRTRPVGIKRDGSNFSTLLRTDGFNTPFTPQNSVRTPPAPSNRSQTSVIVGRLAPATNTPPIGEKRNRTPPPVQQGNSNPPAQRPAAPSPPVQQGNTNPPAQRPAYTPPPVSNPPSSGGGGGSQRGGGGGGGNRGGGGGGNHSGGGGSGGGSSKTGKK